MTTPAPGRAEFDAWFDSAEASPDVMAEILRLRDERDRLTERVAELVTEGNDLRALVAEILAAFGTTTGEWYLAGVGPGRIARWRELAGLEAAK